MKYEIFIVSFKLALKKGDKVLLLTKAKSGCFDFPGGRVEKHEANFSIVKLFKREVGEEIGKGVKYKILNPVFQYRIYNPHFNVNVFATVYEAKYLSGEIKLSNEHTKHEWVSPKKYDLKTKKFGNMEGHLAFKEYFKNFKRYDKN